METLNSLTHFLTWMLIHSIWIGATIMIAVRAAVAFTNKSHVKGQIRILALLVFLAATVLVILLNKHDEPVSQIEIVLSEDSLGLEFIEFSWIERFEIWVSSQSRLICLLWVIGALFSFVRYVIGFQQIGRIKQLSYPCQEERVLATIHKIKQQLSVRLDVEVRISSFLNSPLTSGWLKPIIYLPAGMISGFSTDEIETILYHEMVHIKRFDYLVNLLLASLETFFFFNPFVLAVIRDLRADMEYTCDDWVIKRNNKITYVQALLKLQELRLSNPLGLAARGNNSEFINRINKMMNRTNNSNPSNRLIPGLIILLFLISSLVGSAFVSKSEPVVETTFEESVLQQARDTIRANSNSELKQKLAGLDSAQIANSLIILKGEEVKRIIYSNAPDTGEKMMKHIKKELVRDGILSKENNRVRLMFQYSDLLNGKEVLGDKYPKYKNIFNTYFPVYDSYATTRVFKYED